MKRLFAFTLAMSLVAGCSGSSESNDATNLRSPSGNRKVVVVTYSILGDVVSQLVGDNATVEVIIPDGQEPHEFEPSAKDIERINNAALVVANGLGLEEGLEEPINNAIDAGSYVFVVAEHVTVHNGDPHLWMSPMTISEMIPALAKLAGLALKVDLSDAADAVQALLTTLDAQVQEIMSKVDKCKLVTGHDEMGYFADRYRCEVIGAIIPSLTTTAEANAGELAELKAIAREHDVKAIFTGLGTPKNVARRIANEVDVELVELSTHMLGSANNYGEFMRTLATQIADALA